MNKLTGLSIINCGSIPSLDFLKNLENLDELAVDPIEDGDIKKALEMEKLRILRFNNRRHYNLTYKDATEILKKRWGEEEQVPRPECQRPI